MIKKEIRELSKLANKAGIDRTYFDPLKLPLQIHTHVVISERSLGKTSNLLILGLLMNRLYGCEMAYIRPHDSQITKMRVLTLWGVIDECNYIANIYENEWDSVIYSSKKFYLYNKSTGTMSATPILHLLAVNRHEEYKSTLNVPNVRLIIYDEFIHNNTPHDEFVNYVDLLKTIIRDRDDVNVFMLANSLNKENQYFHDLGIYNIIKSGVLVKDKWYVYTTKLGTTLSIIILCNTKSEKRSLINKLYFGFDNSQLNHITGGNDIWTSRQYPRMPTGDYCISLNNIYIDFNDIIIKCDYYIDLIRYHGIFNVHWTNTDPMDDAIILSDKIKDSRYWSDFNNKIYRLISDAYHYGYIYYSDNDIGNFFESFIKRN